MSRSELPRLHLDTFYAHVAHGPVLRKILLMPKNEVLLMIVAILCAAYVPRVIFHSQHAS